MAVRTLLSLASAVPAYVDFLRRLRAFWQRPADVEELMATIRRRVAQRPELFLDLARRHYFASASPYRALLDLGGWQYTDMEALVRSRGVEAALDALRRSGVYLSFEEFRSGEFQRAGRWFHVPPRAFDNPGAPGFINIRSGGTRSRGRWSAVSLEHLTANQLPQLAIMLHAAGVWDAPVFTWQLGFPSGAGVANWFALAQLRRRHQGWFSLTPLPARSSAHWVMFQTAYVAARRAGIRPPRPQFVPVDRVDRVLAAVSSALAREGRVVLITTPSGIARLAGEARLTGRSLEGVLCLTGGEPLTAGKAAEARNLGAVVLSRYASTETGGGVAVPCARPAAVDDMHLRSDALAMVGAPREVHGLRVQTLMMSTLLPTAPKLLLNVELDDFAIIEERACGCVWEELGCRPHLSGVRSFTKLTGEGTTVLGTNLVDVVERALPAAFGGGSADYQLVEAEDGQHLTRLFLLISPRVGPLDEGAVLRHFHEALEATARRPLGGRRPIWEQARSVRIVRREPIPTALGKLLPFHTLGSAGSPPLPEESRADGAGSR